MHRRSLLGAVATAACAGCIADGSNDALDGTPDDVATDDPRAGLAVTEVYPDEVEREFVSYEYVRIQHQGDEVITLDGVRVVYDGDRSFTFEEDLTLEPRDGVILLSRSKEDSSFLTDPPIYVRSAELGNGTNTSAMEGSGTVELVAPDGTVLDSRRYSSE